MKHIERKTVYWFRSDGQLMKASVPNDARSMAIGARCLDCMPSEDATPVVRVVSIHWREKTYRCSNDEHRLPSVTLISSHPPGSEDNLVLRNREGAVIEIVEGIACSEPDETCGQPPPGGSPARGGVG